MNYKKLVKRNEELEYQLKCKEQELQEYKKLHTVFVIEEEEPPDDVKNVVQMDERLFNMYESRIVELETECEEYKKSKQASYEAMQRKCNKIELKNRALQKEYLCLKEELTTENRKLEDALDRIEDLTIENLEKHYNHCKYAKGCVNPCGVNSEVNLKQILDIINNAKEVNNAG